MEKNADDLLTVIDTIMDTARRRPHLVGHSFGAAAAVHALARRADRVRSVTLIEPSVFPLAGAPERPRAEAEIARMIASCLSRRQSWRSPRAFATLLKRTPAFAKISPEDTLAHAAAVLRNAGGADYQLCCAADTEAALLAEVAADDAIWGLLPALRQPASIVSADPERHDRLWITDTLRRFASRLPNATLRVVPDTNHLMPLEQPEAVCEVVMQAVATSEPRAAITGA